MINISTMGIAVIQIKCKCLAVIKYHVIVLNNMIRVRGI